MGTTHDDFSENIDIQTRILKIKNLERLKNEMLDRGLTLILPFFIGQIEFFGIILYLQFRSVEPIVIKPKLAIGMLGVFFFPLLPWLALVTRRVDAISQLFEKLLATP